jgi:hypothetical protein
VTENDSERRIRVLGLIVAHWSAVEFLFDMLLRSLFEPPISLVSLRALIAVVSIENRLAIASELAQASEWLGDERRDKLARLLVRANNRRRERNDVVHSLILLESDAPLIKWQRDNKTRTFTTSELEEVDDRITHLLRDTRDFANGLIADMARNTRSTITSDTSES